MEPTTAFFVSVIGPALWKVFETLLNKGTDIALDKGFEPLKQLVDGGYDERKDAESLRQAVNAALDDLKKDASADQYDQLLAVWKLTGLDDKARLALAGAAVEMTQFSPAVISLDLLKTLNLGEEKRDLLARFLFHFRNQLKNMDRFKAGIQYANELDALGELRGLSSQMGVVAERLAALLGYEEALILERKLTTDDARALRNYLAVVRQKWEGLMLPLLRKKTGDITNAKLKQVFVPLNMRDVRAEEESRRKMEKRMRPEKMGEDSMEQAQPVEIGELLNRYSRFILIGSPGCGKTTLLSRVALAFAEGRAQNDLGWKGKYLLPIFLRLRNFGAFLKLNRDKYSAPSSGALIAYLENLFRDGERISLTADFFDQRLAEGNCLVLMDGLDEVSDLRSEVAGHVDAFADRYAKAGNVIGLASRPRGFESVDAQLRRVGLAVAEVNPLNLRGISQLMENLLKLIELDPSRRAADLDDLTRAIQSSQELTRIAGTPLFCSALVQVFKYHGARLPNRRVDVFDEIVDLLLGHWHAQQTRYISDAEQLAVEDGTGRTYGEVKNAVSIKRARLSRLALTMQETHQAEIPAEAAVEILYEYLKNRERVPDDVTARLWAENFLLNSHERSGLLVERDPGIYTFLHKGFMEYLAASALVQQSKTLVDVLLPLVDDKGTFEWWEQIILLAGAHPKTPEDIREELIDRLLEKADACPQDSEERLRHLLLAGNLARDMGDDLLPAMHYKRIEEILLHTATRSTFAPASRAAAADTLDELGHTPADLYDFVEIRNTDLSRYYIAKHPVTNLQYKRFLDAPDFADEKYWLDFPRYDENRTLMKETWGRAGFDWLQKTLKDEDTSDGKVVFPRLWKDPRFGIARRTAPVVAITWYEANAYCKWLTAHCRELPEFNSLSTFHSPEFAFRLPTEPEWILAAGGEANERFAFGELKDPKKEIVNFANTRESGINRTTPAGMYAFGAYCEWHLGYER